MNQTTLLRYNFRVLMLNNWMLLVFPLAVSQLTVFWFVLTRQFTPDLPVQSVEMVTPLLAAFLGAHLLSAEYRSRIGAVLASRPVNIGRIVLIRLGVMLALVWALALVSLLAYSTWMQSFDFTLPIVACIPSTLFLTMLALTFATLFRHSLAGFAVAALYWSFDLVPGAPLLPYFSLRSLTSYYISQTFADRQTFLTSWWIAKIVLMVGALLLYLLHSRLVFMLGSSQTLRIRRRAIFAAGSLLLLYFFSGAALRVVYGYAHRGSLPGNDVIWFRYQFASYGPMPLARLFGPGFSRYVGDIANPWKVPVGDDPDIIGETVKHRADLKYVVDRMPTSIWAPSAADALARIASHRETLPAERVRYYKVIVDRYAQSPYLENAIWQTAHIYAEASQLADALPYYQLLIQKVPNSPHRSEALRFIIEQDEKAGKIADATQIAQCWTAQAPVQERFEAWMFLAQLRKAVGDTAGMNAALESMDSSIHEFQHALAHRTVILTPSEDTVRQKAVGLAEATERDLRQGK